MGLSCGIICVILRIDVFVIPECDRHTHTHTHTTTVYRSIPRLA